MTSDTAKSGIDDDGDCSEDWIPDQFGPEPFMQNVMNEQFSDPDEFLEQLWSSVCHIEQNLEELPLMKGAHRDFQIEAITDTLDEMGVLLTIARTSYARACEGQDRFSMVVAKIFFKLGYLCNVLEMFAAPLSNDKRSDALFGLAVIGNSALEQRRSAGQARVQAEAQQKAKTREEALKIAMQMRANRSDVSQEDIAKEIKANLGSVVPKEGSIIKWIQAWERAGALAKPPNRT